MVAAQSVCSPLLAGGNPKVKIFAIPTVVPLRKQSQPRSISSVRFAGRPDHGSSPPCPCAGRRQPSASKRQGEQAIPAERLAVITVWSNSRDGFVDAGKDRGVVTV